MVKRQGYFKVETGDKCHMYPLVDINISVIEVRKLVGRWLSITV